MRRTTQLPSKRFRAQGGVAAVETAMVMIYFITFLFLSFQIGLVAYYQISMDAAAELQARYMALAGLSTDAASIATNKSIPNIQLHAKLRNSSDQNPANIDTAGMDSAYGFASSSVRTGGYSFTVPIPKLSQIQVDDKALWLLKSVNVRLTAFAINGSVREICIHSCIGQGGVTSSTYGNSRDYNSQGDDVVPYFMSFNFMRTCGADPNSDIMVPPAGTANPFWTTCPNMTANQMQTTSINIRALGTAAHLDSSNDYYQQPGMTLLPSYTYGSTIAPADNQAGPFFELWCHRRMFMAIKFGLDLTNSPRPALVPASTIGRYNEPTDDPVHFPYSYNRGRMMTYWSFAISAGKDGGYRPDSPTLPLDFIYYSGPGHPNAGWDAYPLTTTTNYQYDQSNDLTPWFGCGNS